MKAYNAVVFGVVALLLTGCQTTRQARSTEQSGFLGDYSLLTEGADGEALSRYVNPVTSFKKYNKIIVDPIRVYAAPESKLAKLPQGDAMALVDYLDATVRMQLKEDYTLVTEAGPDVMRLRVALTEAKGSALVMDTISSVIPFGMAASAIKQVAVGTPTSVGSARVEMELVDSMIGTRLLAAVDERAGRKYTGKFDKWQKWKDVQDSYDYWAKQLRARLAELKQK